VSGSITANKWFVAPQPRPEAERRIFLFPYAGGGPAVFHKWASEFTDSIEASIVHYPGRGSRFNERPFTSLNSMVDEISSVIPPLLDKPFAFLGHSMGGMIAFELVRRLRQNGFPQPEALFISACRAPQIPNLQKPIHALPEEQFLTSLRSFNGIPAEVLKDRELLGLTLPTLRADFEMYETHQFVPGVPLDCPIIVFGGRDDPRVSSGQLEGWRELTRSRFEARFFDGGHFFINAEKESIRESIMEEIASQRSQ
jgi:medium-chain acyl-[acyl-carrier-protein] hydrolase